MFRSRGQNFRSVFVLLFLYLALFLLEFQDREKFTRVFAFDYDAVRAGEVWRLVTWQFTQSGTGFMAMLSLFITLLLVYMMGSALEEEWGSWHFIRLFLISTLGSAVVAAFLGTALLGSYFVFFTLLFVYAAVFPQQTFYLFGVMPMRVRFLAFFSLAVLVYGVVSGVPANIAAFVGAALGYSYYLSQRVRVKAVAAASAPVPDDVPRVRIDTTAVHNGARFVAIRQALAGGSEAELARLTELCEGDVVPGVNICPPADYKPEGADGYCIRCEGFAECSLRYLRANRPAVPPPPPGAVAITVE